MADKPDNPFKFWEELKRRKVVRVIIGYAAASFVTIELTNNITEPLSLPEWVPTLIIVLLAIGFLIAIVMSWIFDVTPQGIKKTESGKTVKGKTPPEPVERKFKVSDAIIAVLLVAVIILAYPRIFNKNKYKNIRDEDGRISVVVMPFHNMTNDTLWDVWQEGIQNELITDLSNIKEELSVRQFQSVYDIIESTNYASITPSFASDISRKLEAHTFIMGSIKESGDRFRINAQLFNTETVEIYKTFEIDGDSEDNVLPIIDSLKLLIRNYLIIEGMIKDMDYDIKSWIKTDNPEVYRYILNATKLFNALDWEFGIEECNKALKIDSSIMMLNSLLIAAYSNSGQYEKAKQLINKISVYKDDINISDFDQYIIKYWEALFEKDIAKCIKYDKLFIEIDPHNRKVWYQLGFDYTKIWKYEEAIDAFEKVFELDKQWGVPGIWKPTYLDLGGAYHKVGNHKREREVYEMGLELFPEYDRIIRLQAICALSQGDTIEANKYLARYITIRERERLQEAQKQNILGNIYWSANIMDKAEAYYLEALDLNPNFTGAMYNLASLYFEKDYNISQGIELINKVLEFYPESSDCIATKGWGLFREGKYEESLEHLEKSWDMKTYYNHELYLNIQEVKQALARQNSD